jgi:hypothetical protein
MSEHFRDRNTINHEIAWGLKGELY